MRIGTTFYEKCVSPNQGIPHIENLVETGFKHIEFSPHPNLMSFSDLKRFYRHAEKLEMTTAFHSPAFIDPQHYDISFFKESSTIKTHYTQLLNQLSELPTKTGTHPLVVHGASLNLLTDIKEAHYINLSFFEWLANEVSRNNLPFSICLENTCHYDDHSITQTEAQLIHFFEQLKGAPIYLCFDLPHWWRQCQLDKKAPEICFESNFIPVFNQICYAHLHGFSLNFQNSHLSLKNIPNSFFDFVKQFSSKKDQININLEIFETNGFEEISNFENLLAEQLHLFL
jgi:hypothetical protein